VHNVAEHDVADFAAVDLCARKRLAHDCCAELRGGNVLEAATEGTNRGPHSTHYYDFSHNAAPCHTPFKESPARRAGH
jgi:hypothetical protein